MYVDVRTAVVFLSDPFGISGRAEHADGEETEHAVAQRQSQVTGLQGTFWLSNSNSGSKTDPATVLAFRLRKVSTECL